MSITPEQMKALRKTAKDLFNTATQLKIADAEGAAILMESGLIVSGHTQPKGGEEIYSSATGDALRAVWRSCANEVIAAVLIVSKNEDIQSLSLRSLKAHLTVVPDSQIFHARPCTTPDSTDVCIHTNTPIPRF